MYFNYRTNFFLVVLILLNCANSQLDDLDVDSARGHLTYKIDYQQLLDTSMERGCSESNFQHYLLYTSLYSLLVFLPLESTYHQGVNIIAVEVLKNNKRALYLQASATKILNINNSNENFRTFLHSLALRGLGNCFVADEAQLKAWLITIGTFENSDMYYDPDLFDFENLYQAYVRQRQQVKNLSLQSQSQPTQPTSNLVANNPQNSAATQQPVTQQPVTQQPTTQQPTAQQPTTQQSAAQQLTTQQSAPPQSAAQQSVVQQSAPQQPTAQQPTTQQPVAQQPTTQQSAPPQSAAQQSAPPQPTTQQPTTQQTTTLQPAAQQPTTQQPTTQESTQQSAVQQSATQQSVTQQSVAQQPVTQQPAIQQPATQQPTAQQPTTQQSTQQSLSQQPATQQPAAQQPAAQQPAVQQPTTQQATTQQSEMSQVETTQINKSIEDNSPSPENTNHLSDSSVNTTIIQPVHSQTQVPQEIKTNNTNFTITTSSPQYKSAIKGTAQLELPTPEIPQLTRVQSETPQSETPQIAQLARNIDQNSAPITSNSETEQLAVSLTIIETNDNNIGVVNNLSELKSYQDSLENVLIEQTVEDSNSDAIILDTTNSTTIALDTTNSNATDSTTTDSTTTDSTTTSSAKTDNLTENGSVATIDNFANNSANNVEPNNSQASLDNPTQETTTQETTEAVNASTTIDDVLETTTTDLTSFKTPNQSDFFVPEKYSLTPFLSNEKQVNFSEPKKILEANKDYMAILETTKGRVLIDLLEVQTPITVNNFIFLAQNHYYNEVPFHRVLEKFIAQTGDHTGTGLGGPGYGLELEITTKLSHLLEGTVSMASDGKRSSGSQFFFTLGPAPNLDGQYTIFAKVIKGLDVLQSLQVVDPQKDPSIFANLQDSLALLAVQGLKFVGDEELSLEDYIIELHGELPETGKLFKVGFVDAVILNDPVINKLFVAFWPMPDFVEKVYIVERNTQQ